MKKFTFTGVRSLDETFYIDIEAETLEEAQEIIDEGDYEEYNHRTEYVDGSEEIQYYGDEEDDEEEEEDDEEEN
jgi:hypothetical protein